MTTIPELASEAGFLIHINDPSLITAENKETWVCINKELEVFAALVREDEREACAKVCEEGIANADDWNSAHWDQACENRAWAIRDRGGKHD